jgi:hypothetical protein
MCHHSWVGVGSVPATGSNTGSVGYLIPRGERLGRAKRGLLPSPLCCIIAWGLRVVRVPQGVCWMEKTWNSHKKGQPMSCGWLSWVVVSLVFSSWCLSNYSAAPPWIYHHMCLVDDPPYFGFSSQWKNVLPWMVNNHITIKLIDPVMGKKLIVWIFCCC